VSFSDTLADRGMPTDADAERALLGSILQDVGHYHEAAAKLTTESFSLDSHRRIFVALATLAQTGDDVNLITLTNEMRKRKEIVAIGGAAYLSSLTERLPQRRSIDGFIEIVKEKAMLRQAALIGQDLALRAVDGNEDAHDLIANVDARLLKIATENAGEWPDLRTQILAESNALHRQMAGESTRVLTTGIARLDLLLGGLALGEVTVLAARPGQGKTWLMCQLVRRFCLQRIPCHFISCEMSAGVLLRRLWAMIAGVSYRQLRHGLLSASDLERVTAAQGEMAEWPLIIDDSTSLSTDQLVALCRISKRKHGTQFFALDYLQKLRFTRDVKYRHIDVSDAAVGIAKMSKNEDVAFLMISSLTTHGNAGRNMPPTLADLRQSGDIQYEASSVIFIHREVDSKTEKLCEDGELIIAKSRNDDTGAVRVRFSSRSLLFEEVLQAER
jgi:replicative DNA helicase